MRENLGLIGFFALTTFLANLVFSAMGVGMAIIFLFCYQIGVISNLIEENLKYAVFIQTFALFVIQPMVLSSVNLKKNAKMELLLPFILVQFIGTPIGQWLQDYTPVPIMKMIIGILTIFVAFKQIHTIRKTLMARKSKENKVEKRPDVYFMIGCQRSGSNWLQLMISQKFPWIASPHPPHLIDKFLPILKNFGHLSNPENFECLTKAVIEYIQANPVPWTDAQGNVLVMTSTMVLKKCQGQKQSFLAIFEAVMDLYAEANDCSTWLCKSMKCSVYHKELEEHFGDRLKYVYLYRNPKDVSLSFKKAPIGDWHYYMIAEKWNQLQKVALILSQTMPKDTFVSISYESLLNDKESCLESLSPFFGASENGVTNQAYHSDRTKQESIARAEKSSLWKNLTRGKSFEIEKLDKLDTSSNSNELTELDHLHIEAACFDQMVRLGYQPVHDTRPEVSQIEMEAFKNDNEIGKANKERELKSDDPTDWSNRQKQEDILKKFSSTFVTLQDVSTNDKQKTWEWKTLKPKLWPVKPMVWFMLCTGFLDGFLGGLVGVRGPPFIIFFLIFEYPNPIIKANGTVIAGVNTLIRIVSYFFKTPPDFYTFDAWFTVNDLEMYLAVALAGLVASKIGLSLTKYITNWTYKAILAGFLVINGITMITTAALDLHE